MNEVSFETLYDNARGDRGVFGVAGAEYFEQPSSDTRFLELANLTPVMLTAMIDLLPVGVVVAFDATATKIVRNRRLKEMLESETTAEYRTLVGGVEVGAANLPFARAMRTGEAVSGVTVDVVHANGVELKVMMSAAPLRDERGRIVGGVGVFNKIGDSSVAGISARIARDVSSVSGGWYQAIADALPEHVWAYTADGACWYCNERAVRYTGRPTAELFGTGWLESIHPDDREYVKIAWKIASAGSGTFEAEFRVRRHDGCYRWFHGRALPVARPEGETVDWFGTWTDIDDAKREALHTSILRSIARELTIDQDVGELVERVARHCLGTFTAFGMVDVYERDFGLVRLAFVHVDPALEARLRDAVFAAAQQESRLNDPLARAIRERKTQILPPAANKPDTCPQPLDGEQAPNLAAIERAGKIIVPVCEPDGELIGMLTFGETRADARPVDESNRAFAEEVARLLAGTLLRARNVTRALRHHRSVDEIVRSSLPAALPTTEQVELDAVHAAGRTQVDVGAAWYDAVWLSDGRLMLSTGSIAGSGIEAALAMAVLRQTLRAVAFVNAEPLAAIAVADRVLRSLYAQRCAAAFVGVYEPTMRELRYVLCGHPRPVLRLADGAAFALPGADATPLGFGEMTVAGGDECRVRIAAGTLLVLHTGNVSARQALCDSDPNRTFIEAIAQLNSLRLPASALLDTLCGARGCANDVAVMTALFR